MTQYKFDAERYCRNNQGRLHLPDGSDPMERIAEELHMMATALRAKDADYVALRDELAALKYSNDGFANLCHDMERQLAALKDAVRAALIDWRCCIITSQSDAYNALAALVGEVNG